MRKNKEENVKIARGRGGDLRAGQRKARFRRDFFYSVLFARGTEFVKSVLFVKRRELVCGGRARSARIQDAAQPRLEFYRRTRQRQIHA